MSHLTSCVIVSCVALHHDASSHVTKAKHNACIKNSNEEKHQKCPFGRTPIGVLPSVGEWFVGWLTVLLLVVMTDTGSFVKEASGCDNRISFVCNLLLFT